MARVKKEVGRTLFYGTDVADWLKRMNITLGEVNMIDSEICIRCEKEFEDWDHILGDFDQAAIVRNVNIAVTSILFEKSSILLGKTRECKLLRGVYNNGFNKITNDKEEKKMIFR
uniref:Uncharacterized protein n=2 Tax=Rhizophagus irregularis TaxID=588596 RepID=U9TZB6_RHIID